TVARQLRPRAALPAARPAGRAVFASRRRRQTSCYRDWSSDVCSSDLRWVPASSNASDAITSRAERLPAAHRAGVAIGEVNGTSDSVTASRDSGLASVAKEPKNAIMIRTVTGTWLWRASCSVEQVAATAANIAEYRKKPPRKNAMKTRAVAPDT